LDRILPALEQTFDRKPLYPTVQARAAHLLYFIIKDHPFTDGNKRIASFLFLDYLRRNGLLQRPSGQLLIDERALVAIALLVAESKPSHKDLLIRLVINLLATS
jgi:prophage maintenance system killer protein